MPAFLSIGFPVHFISGTNQCSASLGAITALLRFIRGGKIHWNSAFAAAIAAIGGAVLGAKINLFMPDEYLEKIMIVLLPIIAVIILVKRNFGAESHMEELSRLRLIGNAVGIGVVIGAYQGFYAAGAGTFYLLAFALLNKMDLVTASGNTKLVVVFANLSACITYAISGMVIWRIVIVASVFNIMGNYIGASLAVTKGAKIIRPMFFFCLALLFIQLMTNLF